MKFLDSSCENINSNVADDKEESIRDEDQEHSEMNVETSSVSFGNYSRDTICNGKWLILIGS